MYFENIQKCVILLIVTNYKEGQTFTMNKKPAKQTKAQIDKKIGACIREERTNRGISREDLAKILNLTTSHMGLIERGERGATSLTLVKLSNAFGVPVNRLFDNSTDVNEDESNTLREKLYTMTSDLSDGELTVLLHTAKGLLTARQ